MLISLTNDTLPMPLSSEEQKDLLRKMKSGDFEARNLLIVSNLRLVLFEVVHRFNGTSEDMQDFMSEGIIGLIKAVDNFDISKKCAFTTYATRCIDNEILMFLRKNKKHIKNFSWEEPIGFNQDGSKLLIKDTLYVDIDIEEECILSDMLDRMMKSISLLSENEQQLLILYFGLYGNKQYTQQEIADIYGKSKAYVSKKIRDILLKLRSQLEKNHIVEKTKK